MQQHREAVRRPSSGGFCFLDQARLSGGINGVVNHEVCGEQSRGDQEWIGAPHADRSGVDDQVALGELVAEGTLFQGDCLDTFGRADEPVASKVRG